MNAKPVGGSRGVGGGGFVNPKPSAPVYKPSAPVYKPNSYGQTQYSSFSSCGSCGSYSAPGGKSYGYRTPGYGTSYGTSFPSGVGKYSSGGVSKKALGLGVAAGFIGGAAVGAAGAMATYSVYHR